MKKVLSYSVYGDSDKYLVGMIRNLELCKEYYPDWLVYIYYNNTVPERYIKLFETYNSVKLFDMTFMNYPGMFWRFLPNDVDLFIVRDSDSRITYREKLAVDEWVESNKTLHIMRDHPHHGYKILGGMWGYRLRPDFDMLSEIHNYLRGNTYNLYEKMTDMNFLRDVVYNRFVNESVVHDSVFRFENHAKSFPIKMENQRFVGEIINADESIREYQYEEWINRTEL